MHCVLCHNRLVNFRALFFFPQQRPKKFQVHLIKTQNIAEFYKTEKI